MRDYKWKYAPALQAIVDVSSKETDRIGLLYLKRELIDTVDTALEGLEKAKMAEPGKRPPESHTEACSLP